MELVLSMMKILAVCGFIVFGIITNAGGIPTDDRGYIGFRYWCVTRAMYNTFTDGYLQARSVQCFF